jgi:hypothetical protein
MLQTGMSRIRVPMRWIFFFNLPNSSRLATGWTTEGPEFESRKGQEFSVLHIVQTGSGVHPTYPMGTGGSFPGGKAAGGVKLTTHLPTSAVDLYITPHAPSWRSA